MSGAEPSSFADADVIARLRKTNAALREAINTQAVQVETLSGQVHLICDNPGQPPAICDWLTRHSGFHLHFTPKGLVLDKPGRAHREDLRRRTLGEGVDGSRHDQSEERQRNS